MSADAAEVNHRRAEVALRQIDPILDWEVRQESERDIKFVELGKCLCGVRAVLGSRAGLHVR